MRRIYFSLIFGAAAFFLNGCEILDSGSGRSSDSGFKNEVYEIREESASSRKQLNALTRSHNLLQQDYAALAARFTSIQESLSKLQAENQAMAGQIASLQQLLNQEQQARNESLKQMADAVAKQTASALNAAKEDKSGDAAAGPVGSGEFYKYKVQAGATLSAIAKAYNVGIDDIRKANRLQNDFIRVGQILYIPKK